MEYDIRRKKGGDRGYLISMPEGWLISLDGDGCPCDNYPMSSDCDLIARDLDPFREHVVSSRDQLYDNYHNFRAP